MRARHYIEFGKKATDGSTSPTRAASEEEFAIAS
jgi:hypothetical protein